MTAVALTSPVVTFTDRVQDLLERVDFRRADSDEEREAIFRLRHEAYVAEGAIVPNFEKRFTDPYDEMGNAWIFGVYLDQRLVSSIRINVATKEYPDLPAMHVFADDLMPELEAGKIIIDPTRHVVDKAAARHIPHLVYMTMRLGWVAAEFFQSDIVLATVRAEHQAFYRRIFGHKLVRDPRPYPTLIKPLSLMTLDYFAARETVNRRYPFFRSTYFERRMLFERLQEAPARKQGDIRNYLRVIAPEDRHRLTG